jgi:hypothetical protein
MKPGIRLSDLDGSHHIGMLNPCAVLGFADEPGNCGSIMPKLFSKHFEGDCTVAWMVGFIHGRCTALAYLTLQRVPGYL